MREILIRVRNVRINLYFVGAVACVLVVVFILTILFWMQKKSELFVVTSHSMTILTAPIAVLPPHAHKADITGVDSVLAPGHGVVVNSAHYTVPFDMWITGVSLTTRNAPASVLHHLILFKEGYLNSQCSNRDAEIYTIGADSRPQATFPTPYGFFVKKGTKLYLNGMVHNPAAPRGPGGTYTNASIGYTLTYERPSNKRTRPLEFFRLFLYDREHCQDPTETIEGRADVFTVPVGAQHYVKSADANIHNNQARITFSGSGTVVGMGGHLHEEDGGEYLEFLKGNVVMARITPQQIDSSPSRWQMNSDAKFFRIAPGDSFTIRASYSNPYNFPLVDAMGHGVLIVAPDDSSLLMH